MGKDFLILFSLCLLAAWRGSHASITPEDYWKMKLPTTSMPQSIKDALIPSGQAKTNSLATSTNGYDGLLSYAKTSTRDSLANANGYIGLLSYAKDSTKELIANNNGYIGLLSYAKALTKDSLANTNGYDEQLSNAKDSTKDVIHDPNAYGGLLSYGKTSTKDSIANTNGYDGLLSYAKDSTKDLIHGPNAYDGLLSYGKTSTKDSLASTNGYDGLLSYAKDSKKDTLASRNGYGGLSYGKSSRQLLQYNGLLSYAKSSPKCKGEHSPSKDTLTRKLLQYGGLLSYAKSSQKCEGDHSPSPATKSDVMEDHAFFVEEDLHHGKKLSLVFKKGTRKSIFLPREVANRTPFSSDKLPEIYDILSLDPKSEEANVVSQRIELCEEPKVEGVEKQCLTSLESMVDFVVSKIGNNVKSLSTKLEKNHPKMEYTIHGVEQISKNNHETVVCHKMGYPYALFFCHGTVTIRSYKVTLVGIDGTKIEAIAACHKETNDFLSNYMIEVLKAVPGSTRICHFPGAEDNIIWVAN